MKIIKEFEVKQGKYIGIDEEGNTYYADCNRKWIKIKNLDMEKLIKGSEQKEEEIKKRMNLTYEQEEALCWIIGEWYLDWKNKMVNYDNRTHCLGFAKEDLKDRICKKEKLAEYRKRDNPQVGDNTHPQKKGI